MKRKNERKFNSSLSKKPSFRDSRDGSEAFARLPSDYSPPILAVEGNEQFSLLYSSDVNLTIRLKVSEFTRKQATLLAGQALYLVSTEGITIGDWMILEWLYSYLLGSKLDPLRVKNYKELELLLILKVVLLSGTWMGLVGRSQLPDDVRALIANSKWVPNKRTYFSRKNLFSFEKFLQVRIVPIDFLIERQKGTVRYSSYCKGYGESSRLGRRQKTRPSAELDGDEVNLDKEEQVTVPLTQIGHILDLVVAELRYLQVKD